MWGAPGIMLLGVASFLIGGFLNWVYDTRGLQLLSLANKARSFRGSVALP